MRFESLHDNKMISLVKDIRDAMAARDEAKRKEKLYTDHNHKVPNRITQEIEDWDKMVKELQAEHATYPGSRYNPKNKHLL